MHFVFAKRITIIADTQMRFWNTAPTLPLGRDAEKCSGPQHCSDQRDFPGCGHSGNGRKTRLSGFKIEAHRWRISMHFVFPKRITIIADTQMRFSNTDPTLPLGRDFQRVLYVPFKESTWGGGGQI
jgi:hypothetical protein